MLTPRTRELNDFLRFLAVRMSVILLPLGPREAKRMSLSFKAEGYLRDSCRPPSQGTTSVQFSGGSWPRPALLPRLARSSLLVMAIWTHVLVFIWLGCPSLPSAADLSIALS